VHDEVGVGHGHVQASGASAQATLSVMASYMPPDERAGTHGRMSLRLTPLHVLEPGITR